MPQGLSLSLFFSFPADLATHAIPPFPSPGQPSPELSGAGNVLDVLQLLAHLDNGVADQARIQTHGAAQLVLGAGTGVEAHDEVVAVVVGRLQFLGGLGQQKGAPVADAADDAAFVEDNFAGGAGDSAWAAAGQDWRTRTVKGRGRPVLGGLGALSLFDFGEPAWPDYSNHLVQHGGPPGLRLLVLALVLSLFLLQSAPVADTASPLSSPRREKCPARNTGHPAWARRRR